MTAPTPVLAKVRRDLTEATDALAAYWGRNSQHELDYAVADIHRSVEALARALASLTLAVEHLTPEEDDREPIQPGDYRYYETPRIS